MSTARLFVEAVDTAYRLGWALAGWLLFLSTVAAILVLAAVATGAWGVRAARSHLRAPVSAEQPADDSSPARTADGRSKPRPRPAWAQPDEEAA